MHETWHAIGTDRISTCELDKSRRMFRPVNGEKKRKRFEAGCCGAAPFCREPHLLSTVQRVGGSRFPLFATETDHAKHKLNAEAQLDRRLSFS